MAAEDYAIVVGISRYPSSSLGDLKGPENDATNVKNWLVSKTGGSVPESNIKVILSSQFPQADDPLDAEPTVDRIDREFARLIRRGLNNNGRAGRRLYIYLAGHGFAPSIDDGALLTANADIGSWGHHIPGKPYASWFRAAAYFDEIVLFMDCCRDVFRSASIRQPPWDEILTQGAKVRYLYGFATQWSRKSREKPADNGEVRGVFTEALLDGLSGRASDQQEPVTCGKLKAHVLNYVTEKLPKERQEPEFVFSDDFVLVENPAVSHTNVRIKLDQIPAMTQVDLLDGGLNLLESHQAGPQLWEIDLSTGIYKLQANSINREKFFPVAGGEVIDVSF